MSLFPYSEVREVQEDLLKETEFCLKNKVHFIAHAPTGLGKTAAFLSPALEYAIKNKKTVFFLTSRHTQHVVAIDTLKDIKKRHGTEIIAVDLIGKKHMCSVPGVEMLYSSDFTEYCKKQREEGKCPFYTTTRTSSKLTVEAENALSELKAMSPMHVEAMKAYSTDKGMCSYELSAALAKDARVVIADYYYIFSPSIRNGFFNRLDLDMSDVIVVVDEAHNLPDRARSLLTNQLSNLAVKRAIKEAGEDKELVEFLQGLNEMIDSLSQGLEWGGEKLLTRHDLSIEDVDDWIERLNQLAEVVQEDKKQSYAAIVARFLEAWKGEDEGFIRFIDSKKGAREMLKTLHYRSLDPSRVTRDVIEKSHSTILMSGTLEPTSMYKDLLGFPERTIERSYACPFPEENRMNLVVPETSTKYSLRNDDQYRRIAEICSDIIDEVPGNSVIFFPSYHLRDRIYGFFECKKTVFLEHPDMMKEEKQELIEKFKAYKNTGAVLLGAVSGSFGEGIDLPGDFLKCVIIVGLPLSQPTLEVKQLIEYYDKRFGKGWEYGYVNPAFQKTLQNAGRCIRSETDKGIVVFLDERYVWRNYAKNFPKDWNMVATRHYKEAVEQFF